MMSADPRAYAILFSAEPARKKFARCCSANLPGYRGDTASLFFAQRCHTDARHLVLSEGRRPSMRTAMLWMVGLLQLAIGVTMLFGPQSFYDLVPGVNETGPFNPHFVRDVGGAFLVAGAGLLWFARDARAWPAALAGAGFLTLHALIHLWDGLAGRERPVHLVHDLPHLFGVAALALWLAWPRRGSNLAVKGNDNAEMAAAPEARRRRA
jgi:hypothetical protein